MKFIFYNIEKGKWGEPFSNSYTPPIIPKNCILCKIIKLPEHKKKHKNKSLEGKK